MGEQETNCSYGWVLAGNSTEGSGPTKGEHKDPGVKGATKNPTASAVLLYHYYSIQGSCKKKINFFRRLLKYLARKPVHSKMEFLFLE